MPCSVDEPIDTTKLAELAGPAEQSEFVAVDVCPESVLPAVSGVPVG
jgi:hypothetical protein